MNIFFRIVSAFIALVFITTILFSYILVDQIAESGGIKEFIIDVGKEVKDIGRQISED